LENSSPSNNADGTRIAFVSLFDLNNTGRNPDHNEEIFLYDTNSDTFIQITDTSGDALNSSPSINADGTRIAFVSRFDLTNTGSNPDQTRQIFLYDTTTRLTTPVSSATGNFFDSESGANFDISYSPSINADGTLIAFVSSSSMFIQPGPQIFVHDTIGGGTGMITTIPTRGMSESSSPSINADGTLIAFVSSTDLTNIGNFDFEPHIFLATCVY
jgi:Tol biopolymer transport system component